MKKNFILVYMAVVLMGCNPVTPINPSETVLNPTPTFTAPISSPSPTVLVNPKITVEVTKNIAYAFPLQIEESDERLLDIYAPENAESVPVVIFLHGGVGQDKDDQAVTSKMLAELGYVVFTPTWPVSAYASAELDHGRGFREIAETIACAVNFASMRASEYGGDSNEIILSGFSAGGGAGASAALLGNEAVSSWDSYAFVVGGPPPQVSCVEDQVSRDVFAFVGIGGYYEDFSALKEENSGLWALVSYLGLIKKNSELEIRLIHGEKDDAAHFWRAKSFEEALDQGGYKVELITHPGSHYVPRSIFFETLNSLVGK